MTTTTTARDTEYEAAAADALGRFIDNILWCDSIPEGDRATLSEVHDLDLIACYTEDDEWAIFCAIGGTPNDEEELKECGVRLPHDHTEAWAVIDGFIEALSHINPMPFEPIEMALAEARQELLIATALRKTHSPNRLHKKIAAVLLAADGLCLDNADDRALLADALVVALTETN